MTMLHITSDQWVQWLGVYFWPMLRIMALISTAPILSEKSIPKRVKVGLGIIITIVAPSLPPVISRFLGKCAVGCHAAGDDWRRRRLYHAACLCGGAYRGRADWPADGLILRDLC
jgi:hypothetical protein